MHIKTLEIEGFKSYGNRTVIQNFDPYFNAITGLNGTGKSNILDSICFVMGISNLNQVRASNLQDLIFRGGQAGIYKATVKVTFDNRDTSASPIGYEELEEISVTRVVALGGKNKYFINGRAAPNTRIVDFFRSVKLNINNPHFLIMQGRITKVLNMKPLEILSLIEEAAGTRMYEAKKEDAIKTLDKKESKLNEIDYLLKEHISPTINKFREDRQGYNEYVKLTRELEEAKKTYIAWQFVKAQEQKMTSEGSKGKFRTLLEGNLQKVETLSENVKERDSKIVEVEKIMSKASGNGLQKLEEELRNKELIESKELIFLNNMKEQLEEEVRKKTELQKSANEEKTNLGQKQEFLTEIEKQFQDLKFICEKDNDSLNAAVNYYQALIQGKTGDEGEDCSFGDKITDVRNAIANSETELKRAEMAFKHIQEDLNKREAEGSSDDSNYAELRKTSEKLDKEIKKIKADIVQLNYKEGKYENLKADCMKLTRDMDDLKDRINFFESRYPYLDFYYVDPIPNFDRKKVRGPLCTLFKVKDPKFNVALEIIAGSKLFNIVVDDEKVGNLLLQKGELKRRSTLLPLNVIKGYNLINGEILSQAEKLVGKGEVFAASSLINFDNEYTPAMQYAFGSTFVVLNDQSGKKLAFDCDLQKKVITLDGTVFDPSGTVSGGSVGDKGLLKEITKYVNIKSEMKENQQELEKCSRDLARFKALDEKFQLLNTQCDLKEKEAELLKLNMEKSNHHKTIEEIKALKTELEEKKQLLRKYKEIKKKATEDLKDLEQKKSNSTSSREKKLEDANKKISKLKTIYEVSCKKYKSIEQEAQILKLEVEELLNGIPNYEGQRQSIDKSIEQCQNKLAESEESLKTIKEEIERLTQDVNQQKEKLTSHSKELKSLNKEKSDMLNNIQNIKLENQQLEYDISNCANKFQEADSKIESYLEAYDWIEREKHLFGVPKTPYDFKAMDLKAVHKQFLSLEAKKGTLEKNVNMDAHTMLLSFEDEYKSLVERQNEINHTKTSLLDFIAKFDVKKRNIIIEACEKVNVDFGKIFRTLLPGADAKLEPSDGRSPLDGLGFKVAFGNVWKESLSELSGGQRSLVALSLILALLLYNPAPIYILDEIDAALDLSHTQNIGKIIKDHFKKSQFLVVSLKDGMFNNANVLFKTKFSDGMSTVLRSTTTNP